MTPRHGLELPQLELDCMIALWQLPESNAAQVRHSLAENGRPLAYTTVLTVLQRLQRKQMVSRRKGGRAFYYAARVSRAEMRARAVERLIRNYFDSAEELRRYLGAEPTLLAAPAPANGAEATPPSDFDATLL